MWSNSSFKDLVQYNDGFKTNLIGTPRQVAERIVALKDIGVDLVLSAFLHFQEDVAYFGEHVLPRWCASSRKPAVAPKPRDMTRAALNLSNVRLSFGGIGALKGVDLDVRAGEIHAVIGPNGAGKSSLINVITGIYRPGCGRNSGSTAVGCRASRRSGSPISASPGRSRTSSSSKGFRSSRTS